MADLFSISEIFDKRILRIPDFQRGFSWGERQLEDFWDDIEKVASDKIHYTGLITIEKVQIVTNNIAKWKDTLFLVEQVEGNYTPFYIVDGQQRITTAIILISSILERFHKEEY